MNCLLGHGYFMEVDGFGSQSYQNNEMSYVLRSGNAESLRDAIGFVCISQLIFHMPLLKY